MSRRIAAALHRVQSILDFRGWSDFPQFDTNQSLGRATVIGTLIGTCLGVHLTVLFRIIVRNYHLMSFDRMDDDQVQMLLQWTIYFLVLCAFHLAEFFVTAIYNPGVVTTDSFMVNHSVAYTAAALFSWTEFWIRFFFLPCSNFPIVFCAGVAMVLFGQIVRSLAMKTAGESFNHVIQYLKKDNHRLVTHGIYEYFRHPSYVGFFYWAIGTQLLLCNPISISAYSVAAWKFFRSRIPYEETTLKEQYPDVYLEYMKTTWIGIPFIKSDYSHSGNPTDNRKHHLN